MYKRQKQLIGDAAWGELDYFILDTPPGTSDIHLTLVQTLATHVAKRHTDRI